MPDIPSWAGKRRLFVALAVVAIIALRKYDSVANPQFWAEDGGLFFIEAALYPTGKLFAPYMGYLHFLPRMVAVFGRNLPVVAAPAFYAWFALLATGVVAWGIQSPRVRLPGTAAAALAIALIPHTGEVYIAVCNLQWIMAVGLFALALASDPTTWPQRTCDLLSLPVLGLTGPFIAAALPLFAWRAWRRRSAWSLGLLVLAAGCLALQAPAMLAYRPAPHPEPWAPLHGAAVVARRIMVSLAAGGLDPGETVCILLFCIVPAAMLWVLWRRRAALPGGCWLALAGLLTLAASAYKVRFDTWPFFDLANGDRYFFVPKVLLVWLIAAIASTCGRTARRTLAAAALVAFAVSLPHFIFAPYPDLHWKHYAPLLERGQAIRVPILPEGFSIPYPGGVPRKGLGAVLLQRGS